MYDGKVVFKVDLDTKDFVPQLEQTRKELDDLLVEYEEFQKPLDGSTKSLMAGGKAAQYEKEQLTKLSAKIQETTNKYIDLKQKQDDVYKTNMRSVKNIGMMGLPAYDKSFALQYNQLGTTMTKVSGQLPYIADGIKDIGKETIEAGKQAEISGNMFDKGFSKSLKSIKSLAMGIIGIRSIYFLARRAASAYMSEDTELTEKMNKAWVNLGAFLEPFLSFVADAMLKITGYLNVYIKALTGIDFLARANEKALKKQAKAQNELNAATEKYQQYDFDVIRTQSAIGGGAGAGTGGNGDSSTLGDVELNENLVKAIQNYAKFVKDLIDLLTFRDLVEAVNELDEATAIEQDITDNLVDVATNTARIIAETPNVPKADLDVGKRYKEQNEDYIRLIADVQKDYDNLLQNFPILTSTGLFGVGKRELNIQQNYRKMLQANIRALIDMAKQGRLTEEGYASLLEMTVLYSDELEKTAKIEGENKFALEDVRDALRDYALIYPRATSEILGFNNVSDKQQRELALTVDKLLNGKGTVIDYATAWKNIPSMVKTEAEARTEKATELIGKFENVLFGVPKTTKTTINVDDKDAESKTANIKNNLLNIPSIITTTIKTTLDTSDADWKLNNLKSKLENIPGVGSMVSKLFSVLGIRGFASGGYISQPTFAMVGEGKYNEYVIPDGEDYISRLANEIGRYGSGGGTTNVYLDGRLIQRQVSKTSDRVSFTRNGR